MRGASCVRVGRLLSSPVKQLETSCLPVSTASGETLACVPTVHKWLGVLWVLFIMNTYRKGAACRLWQVILVCDHSDTTQVGDVPNDTGRN